MSKFEKFIPLIGCLCGLGIGIEFLLPLYYGQPKELTILNSLLLSSLFFLIGISAGIDFFKSITKK